MPTTHLQDYLQSEDYFAGLKQLLPGTYFIKETDETAHCILNERTIYLSREQKYADPVLQFIYDWALVQHEYLHLKYTDAAVEKHNLGFEDQTLLNFLEDGRIDRIGREEDISYAQDRRGAATLIWRGNNEHSLHNFSQLDQTIQLVSPYIYVRPKFFGAGQTPQTCADSIRPFIWHAVNAESSEALLPLLGAITHRLYTAGLIEKRPHSFSLPKDRAQKPDPGSIMSGVEFSNYYELMDQKLRFMIR